MLPHVYEVPAAVILLVSGVLACFAGYRLFKFVLAIYGFILGAMVASSTLGPTNTTGIVLAAIFGGVAGSMILVLAYFLGVALVGAGLGALVAHVGWGYYRTGDPPMTLVIILAVLGAVGSMLLQRYVMILGTAFGGAWTALIGGLSMAGDRRMAQAAASGDVWILYPTSPSPDRQWLPIAWLILGIVGTIVQLWVTGRRKKKT
jgi:hypothetical protein